MCHAHLFVVLAIILACGCASPPPPPPEPTPEPLSGPGVAVSPDGVEIAFTVAGSGSPALVFIHGWMCDQSYWQSQVPALVEDFTVVTVDLPGHGLSGLNRDAWTLAVLGGDVQAVVDHIGLDQVILVGHSMGGPVALEAARLRPGQVVGVVGIDTFQNVESEWDPEVLEKTFAAAEADFVGFCTSFVTGMFARGADPDLVTAVVEDMCSGPPEIGVALLRCYTDYDMIAAIEGVSAPVRAVNSTKWPTDIEANRRHADFDAVLMDGVGHFLMQEAPEAFNQNLRTVIDELVAAGKPADER